MVSLGSQSRVMVLPVRVFIKICIVYGVVIKRVVVSMVALLYIPHQAFMSLHSTVVSVAIGAKVSLSSS